MFGPGWYQNWLSQGPLVLPADGPTLTGPGRVAVPAPLTFAHAAGCFGEGTSIPCFYIDTFPWVSGVDVSQDDASRFNSNNWGTGVPPSSDLGNDQWACQRYQLAFDSADRPASPVLPVHGPYPDYAVDHPIVWHSDITETFAYEVSHAGGLNDLPSGYGRFGPCTLTLEALSLDGDYAFQFAHDLLITIRNTTTGRAETRVGRRRLYPVIPGIYDAPYAPAQGQYGRSGPGIGTAPASGAGDLGQKDAFLRYEKNTGASRTSTLLTGPNPPPIIRVLVGATFSAGFAYPTFINSRTGKGSYPIAAAVQIDLLPNASDDALTQRRAVPNAAGNQYVVQDVPAYVNAGFVTDLITKYGGIPSALYPPTQPLRLGLYPALKYYEPFQGNTTYYQTSLGDYRYDPSAPPSQLSNTGVFGDVSAATSQGLFALSRFAPTSTGVAGNVYPHDADIALTITPETAGFGSRSRWIWNGPIHITGHLSDHDISGSTPPTDTDTDASDKGALDQDPATGRVYLAKVVAGKVQIAAREGWQGLGGVPARDYAPLLGPDGAALAGKSPHLASRTAGGDAARGGLTTLVYQDASGHVVLAMSDDGLHTVGAPTMPIFTETGGLPCHLHDESTGLTYVAASFAVAPAATAPPGTVSTTEDLRLVRLGANLVPVPWADGKAEKVIKLAAPKAGRPSLTQNRMDPEQPLLLVHGDKKFLGSQGGEIWQEITT